MTWRPRTWFGYAVVGCIGIGAALALALALPVTVPACAQQHNVCPARQQHGAVATAACDCQTVLRASGCRWAAGKFDMNWKVACRARSQEPATEALS